MRRQPLIYIAGPYRASTRDGVETNVRAAAVCGLHFARAGWVPVVPHTMMDLMDADNGVSDQRWLEITAQLLLRCDAAFFLPGWQGSPGACEEMRLCIEESKPFWERVESVPPPVGFLEYERHMDTRALVRRLRQLRSATQGASVG